MSHLDVSICAHALSSCDISNLQSITGVATDPRTRISIPLNAWKDWMLVYGIPVEVVQRAHDWCPAKITLPSKVSARPRGNQIPSPRHGADHSVCRYLADSLSSRAMNLKRLTILMPMRQQQDIHTFSVLTALSDRLEDLRLDIWMGAHARKYSLFELRLEQDICDEGLQRLGEVIESMPLLKKLYEINSGSLEEIAITDASFRVNECICPLLKEIKCKYPTSEEGGAIMQIILFHPMPNRPKRNRLKHGKGNGKCTNDYYISCTQLMGVNHPIAV